jgi:branched-subunit amino acid transport protein AzlD
METSYLIASITIATVATVITRFTPFILFAKKEPSPLIKYLEWNMPIMIMVILVFYALKDVKWESYPFGMAELIGVGVTVISYLKYKNSLLSIFLATFIYMMMVQYVFV